MRSSPIRQKVWTAMRVLGRFHIRELEQVVGEDKERWGRYFRVLRKAGYVKKEGIVSGGGIYRLVNNTGPIAPKVYGHVRVIDPNTGEEIDTRR